MYVCGQSLYLAFFFLDKNCFHFTKDLLRFSTSRKIIVIEIW